SMFLSGRPHICEPMIRMVNILLQLSRMDNKELALMRENIDFVPFFECIIDRFEMNKGSKIQFIRKIPNESYIVWIDRDRMTQVVDNIISNAVKYSPEGGNITLKVEKRMS